MNVKNNFTTAIATTSRPAWPLDHVSRATKRLVSAGEAKVSVSGGERLDLELSHLVPIPGILYHHYVLSWILLALMWWNSYITHLTKLWFFAVLDVQQRRI